MKNTFAVIIDANIPTSMDMAEGLNNKVFEVDMTSKTTSILSQVHSKVLTELKLIQKTKKSSVNVMYLNDFVWNFNNNFVDSENTFIAVVSHKL